MVHCKLELYLYQPKIFRYSYFQIVLLKHTYYNPIAIKQHKLMPSGFLVLVRNLLRQAVALKPGHRQSSQCTFA
jgi:hypothetical protein